MYLDNTALTVQSKRWNQSYCWNVQDKYKDGGHQFQSSNPGLTAFLVESACSPHVRLSFLQVYSRLISSLRLVRALTKDLDLIPGVPHGECQKLPSREGEKQRRMYIVDAKRKCTFNFTSNREIENASEPLIMKTSCYSFNCQKHNLWLGINFRNTLFFASGETRTLGVKVQKGLIAISCAHVLCVAVQKVLIAMF